MKKRKSAGFTLLEVLMSLGISSVILTGIVIEFASVTKYSRDLEVKAEVRETLRSLLEMVSTDIRNAGAGMPIGQTNFQTTTAGIADYALPVLTTSTSTVLQLRLNENGKSTLSSSLYDNTLMQKEFNLLSTDGMKVNDMIYVSEMTSGGTGGMYAKVATVVNSTKVTLSDIILPTGVTSLRAGSISGVVSNVTLQYNSGTNSITRTNASGTVTLAPKSSVTFSYLDTSGASILPLTSTNIATNLAAIGVTITVTSSRTLRSGSYYSDTKSLNIACRNILNNR
jgi:prepilin-type N-terminal cleavage/methylation domain-containing protein